MHERYLEADVRSGRRILHQQIANSSAGDIAAMDKNTRMAVGYTLAVMNSIAIACEARYVELRVVDQSMGQSFARAMAAAKPYLDHMEEVRGFRPYVYAERLAARIEANNKSAPSLSAQIVGRGKLLVGDFVEPKVDDSGA